MIVDFFKDFFCNFRLLICEFEIVEEFYCMINVYVGDSRQWCIFDIYVVCFLMQMCFFVVGVWMIIDKFG